MLKLDAKVFKTLMQLEDSRLVGFHLATQGFFEVRPFLLCIDMFLLKLVLEF